MSWDWKKAIGVKDLPQGAILTAGPGARRSRAGVKDPAPPPGAGRAPSIAWRTGAAGYGLPGSSVVLVEDCDHPCPFCHGRGRFASGSICPVCNDRKTVHVEPPSVRCAFCGGQGQMPPHSNLSCWVCKGKGLISVAPPVQTCPDCQGRGKKPGQSLYCPRCRGVGVVPWTSGF
jgi:Zn finger protein HypA/HybF involved in hydrogenase expression